jgi:hypothetical protein
LARRLSRRVEVRDRRTHRVGEQRVAQDTGSSTCGAASTTVVSDGAVLGELVSTDDAGQRGVRLTTRVSMPSTPSTPSTPSSETTTAPPEFSIPKRLLHVDLEALSRTSTALQELQIPSPMNRGSVGAHALNTAIQTAVNPARDDLAELRLGQRILRTGDRVIQRRNDYDLGVFNDARASWRPSSAAVPRSASRSPTWMRGNGRPH